MPSASAKLEKQVSQETTDPLKLVLIMIEHKKRNLEKRKSKLEAYRDDQKNGKELKGEQLAAVAKYDEVCKTLEFAVDMAKQVQSISNDHAKVLKKQQRKDQLERTQGELNKVKELLVFQDVLLNMGNDVVRSDFLAGNDGAVLVKQEELNFLDELYPLVSPKREEGVAFTQQVSTAADHFMNLIDGRNKEVIGSTYAALREILQRINGSGYFEKNTHKLCPDLSQEPVVNEAAEVVIVEAPESEAVEVAPAVVAPPPQATTPTPMPAPPADQAFYRGPQGGTAVPPAHFQQPVPQPPMQQAPSSLPPVPQPRPPQQQPPAQVRPVTEVIGQGNSAINFLQESQLDAESPTPSHVDLTAMLQFPPQAGGPPAVLPPGRNPSAPAASAVPQPEFPSTIPTQTYTNQNFPGAVVPPGGVVVPVPPQQVSNSHIPAAYSQQPNNPPTNFLPPPAANQDVQQAPVPMPVRVVHDEKVIKNISQPPVQTAPASFAQAAQSLNSQSHVKAQNYTGGAPPGFAAKVQQSQFQPIPTIEQAEEQDREEENSWANDGHDGGEQGYRSGYRGRGGRGRGRGYSNRGPRGGQQNGGGRSGGYQNRDGNERAYENGYQQKEYGGGFKRGPPRDGSGRDYAPKDGRGGQGYRSGGSYRGENRGNRGRGSSGGGTNQGPRPQHVKQ